MEETVFDITCDMCDTHTEVIVVSEVDEFPAFCPMCGEAVLSE